MTRPIAPESAVFDKARLEALRRLAIMDTPPEAQFDRLTDLATEIIGVPIALVSLVDDERQFFKCQVGLPEPWASARGTPLTHSFCQHVVDLAQPLVLEDAREHDVLKTNMAIRDLDAIAYAGIPLTTSDGYTLGTFCAIDTKPREWTDWDLILLKVFAAATMSAIELHLEREEARKTQIELQQAFEDLGRVQEQVVAFQRLEIAGQLAAGVAHDFNNLLQVMLMALDSVGHYLEKDHAAREDLDQAKDVADRGTRLVRELLRFTAVKPEELSAFALDPEIALMRGLLERSLGRNVQLELRLDAPDVTVEWSKTYLEQVLLNLVINARDAMPDGGIVTVGTTLVAPDEVQIVVGDTGTGMSQQQAARIFEPFFTTKPKDSHLGLGLATTFELVKTAGGSISAESEPGKGSTFKISLAVLNE